MADQPQTKNAQGEIFRATTSGVQVSVSPRYLESQSQPDENNYVWAYDVEIINDGSETVQLRDRTWRITDGRGEVQNVHGPGVVGEQPILNPGDSFRYRSGCPLKTPSGFMAGSYTMVLEDGSSFEAEIPAFPLDLPGARRNMN